MIMTKSIQLSEQQNNALSEILKWYKTDAQCFVLAGYAGSGKSTLAREVSNILPHAIFCAYTGKAAHVLRSKGLHNSCTIHSLLYNYAGKNDDGDPVFTLRDGDKSLVIVDEYSMISGDLIDDIKSKCKKILFLGDPAQLPPIKEGVQILKPDFFLTEIHRQALDNPIIKWAHEVRNGKSLNRFFEDGCFTVKSKNDLTQEELVKAEQVIVGKNITKSAINNDLRDILAYSDLSNLPIKGEKMICLQNNHKELLFNGMIFNTTMPAKNWDRGKGCFELVVNNRTYSVWDGDVLGKDAKTEYKYQSRFERFDYAYAITCHKAQGSEFDDVIIFDESWGAQRFNWLYTAITRAKQRCTLVI